MLSYRAILVAIVSQNSFVLVAMAYRTIIARYAAKWGIAQMCLCETKYQGGTSDRVKMEPFVLLALFPLFQSHVWVKCEENQCDEGNRGLVGFSLLLWAFRLFWGSWNANPPFFLFDLRMGKCPIVKRRTLLNKGKRQNDKGFHFHSCTRGVSHHFSGCGVTKDSCPLVCDL